MRRLNAEVAFLAALGAMAAALAFAADMHVMALAIVASLGAAFVFIDVRIVAIAALVGYLPDQLLIATGATGLTGWGRLLPLAVLLVGIANISSVARLTTGTKWNLALLVLLVFWYWLMLPIGFSTDSARYVAQLTLLAFATVLIVALLNSDEWPVRACAAQAACGFIAAVYMLIVPAHAIAADRRIMFEGLGINAISAMLGVSIVLGLSYMHIGRSHLVRFAMPLMMAITYAAVVRTGTRSVILGVPMAAALVYALAGGRRVLQYTAIAIGIVMLVGAGLLVARDTGYISGRLAERVFLFGEAPAAIMQNSRIEFWRTGLAWYAENPIGAGPGSWNEINAVQMGGGSEAHNTLLSTLIQVNVIGVLLLAGGVALLIWRGFAIASVQGRIAALMPSVFLLMQIAKASALQTRLFWVPLAYALLLVEWAHRQHLVSPAASKPVASRAEAY